MRNTVSPIATERKQTLILSALATIGEKRSLDITVQEIAKRAGCSSALAHHYFGSKEAMIVSIMQHLLRNMGEELKDRVRPGDTPKARLVAIVEASFAPWQMQPASVSAWTVFYVKAQSSPEVSRLLRIYLRRLHSNLMFALLQVMNRRAASRTASSIGAMIDGAYLREGISAVAQDSPARQLCLDYLDLALREKTKRRL